MGEELDAFEPFHVDYPHHHIQPNQTDAISWVISTPSLWLSQKRLRWMAARPTTLDERPVSVNFAVLVEPMREFASPTNCTKSGFGRGPRFAGGDDQ